jgi:hypothetical protein
MPPAPNRPSILYRLSRSPFFNVSSTDAVKFIREKNPALHSLLMTPASSLATDVPPKSLREK